MNHLHLLPSYYGGHPYPVEAGREFLEIDGVGAWIGRLRVVTVEGDVARVQVLESIGRPQRVGLHFRIPIRRMAAAGYFPTAAVS